MTSISINTAMQAMSVSVALVGAGGIATLSIFDIPEIKSQPADRALPMTRWLFSRGSHIFPSAAILSSAGFAYLAYKTLPNLAINSIRGNGYVLAAVLAFSIAPFTSIVMIPNNFALIEKNEQLGGSRSAANAKNDKSGRTAEQSVNNEGQISQFTDLSGAQTKTKKSSTTQDDKEVRAMLDKFQSQNMMRALLLGAGGLVGLLTALP